MDAQMPTDAGVSACEADVLSAVGEHLTNAEIAARVFISVRTVESHLVTRADAEVAVDALAPEVGAVPMVIPS
jgi:FixJ family two-component response regulator